MRAAGWFKRKMGLGKDNPSLEDDPMQSNADFEASLSPNLNVYSQLQCAQPPSLAKSATDRAVKTPSMASELTSKASCLLQSPPIPMERTKIGTMADVRYQNFEKLASESPPPCPPRIRLPPVNAQQEENRGKSLFPNQGSGDLTAEATSCNPGGIKFLLVNAQPAEDRRKEANESVFELNIRCHVPCNAGSTPQALNMVVWQGNGSTNPNPNACTQPEVTSTVIGTRNVDVLTVAKSPCNTAQTKTNGVPDQKENNKTAVLHQKLDQEEPGLRCNLKTTQLHDSSLDDLAVKFSNLQLKEKLGSGNFGSVYAGTLHGNKEVAVKSLKAGGSMTIDEFRQEAETMHVLRHPNLVSLLGISEDRGTIYIITERMSRGSLLALLREDTDDILKFEDIMDMAVEVVEGMCYLEMNGFVHRDLRAANVLVGDGNIAKIADFGLTRLIDDYYEHEHFYQEKKGTVFPYKWTAPEAIKKQKFTVKSDVWSFGILLYEMVTYGDVPYAAMSNSDALDWVEDGNRLKRPTKYYCPSALYSIMLQCWMPIPKERPGFASIKGTLIDINRNAQDLFQQN